MLASLFSSMNLSALALYLFFIFKTFCNMLRWFCSMIAYRLENTSLYMIFFEQIDGFTFPLHCVQRYKKPSSSLYLQFVEYIIPHKAHLTGWQTLYARLLAVICFTSLMLFLGKVMPSSCCLDVIRSAKYSIALARPLGVGGLGMFCFLFFFIG